MPWGCTPVLGIHPQLVLSWAKAEDPSLDPQFCTLNYEQWPRWLCQNNLAISLACQTPPLLKHKYLAQEANSAWTQPIARVQSQHAPGERAHGCRRSENSFPDKAGKFQRCVALSSSHSYSQTKTTYFSRKLQRNALAEFFSSLKSEMQSLLKC